MTTNGPVIEILPAADLWAKERNKATLTATYDVVCERCGPVAHGLMYPSACGAKNDHLCDPNPRNRSRKARPMAAAAARAKAS